VTFVLVAVIVVAGAIAAYAYFAPRAKERAYVKRQGEPLHATTAWTSEAGDEFAGLSESARCDMIFAVGALDDDRSQRLLEHALNDPSEAVALAAAHVLSVNGRSGVVQAFLRERPGARADRIAQTLSLLDSPRA
jgi:hypothetical protein